MKIKLVVLLFTLSAVINCAPGKHDQSIVGQSTPVASTVPETPVISNSPSTVDAESDTTGATPATPAKTNVIGNAISNFFGGLFGTKTDTPTGAIGHAVGCGVLPSILNFGVSYLTGGNVIVGSIVSQVANGLLKCSSTAEVADLASLIPAGASGKDIIFNVISQVLKMNEGGQDILSVINTIKNPKDITGIINILTQLKDKTGDSKILDVLNMFVMMSASQGNLGDSCANMDAKSCQVFNVINLIRSQAKLPALKAGLTCIKEAQAHSKDMALNQLLSNLSSLGLTTKERMAQLGIGSPWAEIVVKGSSLTAEDAVNIWMGSDGHRKNILSNLFGSVGVGYVNGYFTTCFSK